MLFIGAGGLAIQVFEDLLASDISDIVFWSGTGASDDLIRENFRIINTDEQVIEYFNSVSKSFVVTVGNTESRKRMAEKFTGLGGELASFISPFSKVSSHKTKIGLGTMVLNDVNIEPRVSIGDLCLLNKKSHYGHATTVGSFCEVGPTAMVGGEVTIGDNCLIGMGSLILSRMKVGNNVIISAGSVVTKNIPDYAVVEGVPAKIRFYRKK